ncbi:MAG: outer membrane protein assembly factor BamD, partial [Gammaproteobacteria bacterium]|nr:outer membrane protein assembly factor BamD [Gammaproteobacteria bacterium]
GDDKSVKAAVSEFDTVIKKYPKSDKSKEASLKLGFAYLLQNKNADAKIQFKKVIKQYPGTSVAKLAEARLAQLS